MRKTSLNSKEFPLLTWAGCGKLCDKHGESCDFRVSEQSERARGLAQKFLGHLIILLAYYWVTKVINEKLHVQKIAKRE